jgi:hypothetical protein
MKRGHLVCTAFLLLMVGCGSTQLRVVPTPRYYGYSVAADSSLGREAPPSAPAKATTALQKMKRVAFVPPDMCLDMRAGDTSTTVDKRVLRMQCGVTMSELEREAEKAGFDVVTWQSLKGGTRPLEQAKEQKIDLLFEVNELDVIDEGDSNSSMEFRYFWGEGANPPQPLQVTPADNEACKAYHARNAPKASRMTSVLDIKMVQVSNGSVLWSYRHEEDMKAADATGLVKFGVSASQQFKTSRPWWPWLLVLGGVVLIAAIPDAPVVGLAVAGGGVIAALVVGKKTSPIGQPVYESPQQVLCRRPHMMPAAPRPAGPTGPTMSDTFREESRTTTKDFVEERRRELIKRSVMTFMKQLTGAGAES